MTVKVHYKASVEKDLRKLEKSQSKRVLEKFEQAVHSGLKGEGLKGPFQGLYKFRVGDFRVIYAQIRDGILVLRISHRKESYRQP